MEAKFVKTKTGIPALWESGGGYTNTGDSFIICDKDGDKKPAIYHRTSGSLACGDHALIPVSKNDKVIFVTRYRDDISIKIYSVVGDFTDMENSDAYYGTLSLIAKYVDRKWSFLADTKPQDIERLTAAIEAAVEKSKVWHCREAVYVR